MGMLTDKQCINLSEQCCQHAAEQNEINCVEGGC